MIHFYKLLKRKIFFICILFLFINAVNYAFGMKGNGTNPRKSQSQTGDDIELIRTRLAQEFLNTGYSQADSYLATQASSGNWSDINYSDKSIASWAPITHLNRLYTMSVAYLSASSLPYHSDAMLNGISNGLKYWYDTKPVSNNWWWNQIGQQAPLEKILILMEKSLPDTLIKTSAGYLYDPTMVASYLATGANLSDFATEQFIRGLLNQNPNDIVTAVDTIQSEIVITTGDGIQRDYSFHQHGSLLYNAGYGLTFLSDISNFASLVQGTQYSFQNDKLEILSDYLLEGSRLMVRGGFFDYSAEGRNISRKGVSQSATGLVSICDDFSLLLPENQSVYDHLKNHIQGKGNSYSYLGNKYFWNSDFMAHQRKGYYCSVKMCSMRTEGTEIMNGENLKSGWLPFGLTYILQRGDEYKDIAPVWDWARLPGVTSAYYVPTYSSTSTTFISQNEQFVGGVSDGTYGAASMILNKNSVMAHKAWFFFDNEFVALGTGITSTGTYPVNTTLNQCLLKGNVIVDGNTISTGLHELDNVGWVYHDGIGYVFPQKQSIMLKNESQSGSWGSINTTYSTSDIATMNVFSIWIDHGIKPLDSSYQYIVVPAINSDQLSSYAANNPIRILSNTSSLQAVKNDSLGITEAVFYSIDTLHINGETTVWVDHPCMVIVREKQDSTEIAVSNPLAQSKQINVTLSTPDINKYITFNLPGSDMGGSTQIKTVDFVTSSIDKGENILKKFSLFQNYPNPFNPTTTIKYQIPKSGLVQLKVYNILGREIATLVNEYQTAGEHSVQFSADDQQQTTDHQQLSSGIYFYRLKAGEFAEVKKLILLK